MTTTAIPTDHPVLSPYIVVKGAADAMVFYEKAFGAAEVFRLTFPDGAIGHAELAIGASRLMLAEEFPDFGALSPISVGGSPVSMQLYVQDVDQTVADAVALGATILRPLKDEFYGDRTGMIADPFGHKWHLSSRRENLTPEEMQRRMDTLSEA